ncbi:MAG: hypothetical protein ACXADY_00500 [Candidatus Hodarchaeales archaeon]|jgi:hypothetical protein
MAIIEAIEVNNKKIETLTRVARLLGDKIREQNIKIDKLQEEISKINEQLERTAIPSTSPFPQPEKTPDPVSSAPPQYQTFQEKPQMPELTELLKEKSTIGPVEKDSEKEKLLKALKVIDDL